MYLAPTVVPRDTELKLDAILWHPSEMAIRASTQRAIEGCRRLRAHILRFKWDMKHPILIFDGECNFCRACVRWLVEHDPAGRLHFATLQSDDGRRLLASHGVDPDSVESLVLVEEGRCRRKSEAVLEAMKSTKDPWRRVEVFRRIPRPLRDFIYNRISKNRSLISRLLGTKDRRYVPAGEERRRFLSC